MDEGYSRARPARSPCTPLLVPGVLLHDEERSALDAHLRLRADQLVVEPQGVSRLQGRVRQRIAHALLGDTRCRACEGKDGDAVSGGPFYGPGAGFDDE